MSLPRYGDYRDSGVEWIGTIPQTWGVKRIKHTTYLKGRVGWKGLTSDEYLDSGYAYLVTGTDFSGKFIDWGDCHCVEKARYEDDPFIQLRNGDLLITKDGTIGKLALVAELDRPACLNSGIFLVRPTSDYVTEYMYWVLRSEPFKIFCDLSSLGSTIQHLYQNVFEDFAFPVPSLTEQRGIASFLDREAAKIDTLIAEQEKLIALLAEKRQAIISHAVTKGLNPNAPMKDSGVAWLGTVPAHWEMKRLKNISPFITVGIVVNPTEYVSEEGLPFIYGGDIAEGQIWADAARRISAEDSARQSKTILEAGDLLTVRVGAPGITAVVPENCAGGNCASVMLTRRGEFDSNWLCFAMNSRMVRFQVEVVQYGAAQEQFNISHAINFWVATPPRDEQRAIADFLTAALEKVDTLSNSSSRAIELLKERRSALIAAAVTGQIDVRNVPLR